MMCECAAGECAPGMGLPHFSGLADAIHGAAVCWHMDVSPVLFVSTRSSVCHQTPLHAVLGLLLNTHQAC